MVELIAENGKTAKHTAMASARDPKAKRVTKVLGITASNSAESMFGQTGIVLKANGSGAVDTDSGLNTEENGLTKVSGKKDLKRGTEYRNRQAELDMKEVGRLVCKRVMESRSTLMEVRFNITGQKYSAGKTSFVVQLPADVFDFTAVVMMNTRKKINSIDHLCQQDKIHLHGLS